MRAGNDQVFGRLCLRHKQKSYGNFSPCPEKLFNSPIILNYIVCVGPDYNQNRGKMTSKCMLKQISQAGMKPLVAS